MLVLTRKAGEQIVIDGCIGLTVLGIDGSRVRLGFVAPPEISIHRQEVHDRISEDRPAIEEHVTDWQ